jgi:hypothetical protein
MVQIIGLTWIERSLASKDAQQGSCWALNVPDAEAGRMFSIEDKLWDGQKTSVSATVGRMLGQSRAASRRVGTRGGYSQRMLVLCSVQIFPV